MRFIVLKTQLSIMNEIVCSGTNNLCIKCDSFKAHVHVWTSNFETHGTLNFAIMPIGAVSPSLHIGLVFASREE